MINADGVIVGNTRCSMIGRDVNRLFSKPNQKLTPEPYYLRALVKEMQKYDKHKVLAYLDVHAHSGRKSIFMYGPYFPLHSSKYLKIRALPKLVSERTEMFRFFSCKFKLEKYKENCARIAIWRDFNITNCFTIESSQFGFLNRERETIPFSSGLLQEFGECLVHSIFEYNLIQEEDRRLKMVLAKKLQEQRKRRQTIAEILGGPKPIERPPLWQDSLELLMESAHLNKIKEQENAQSSIDITNINNIDITGSKPKLHNFNENPNEAYDIMDNENMNIQHHEFIHNDMSDDSLDCNAYVDSSSSDESILCLRNQKVEKFHQTKMQARFSKLNRVHTAKNNKKIDDMLAKKQGLAIVDGEELFHMLYNPYYTEWNAKKQNYIKYDNIRKMRTLSHKKSLRPQSSGFNDLEEAKVEENLNEYQLKAGGIPEFNKQEREQYYMKEIRTFDEVYKEIKKQIKEKERMKRQSKLQDHDDEDEYEQMNPYDEYGMEEDGLEIPQNIEDLEDQDISRQDREVLNERILGILNVFNDMTANCFNPSLSQKQTKMLEELGQKSLSIEQPHKRAYKKKVEKPNVRVQGSALK